MSPPGLSQPRVQGDRASKSALRWSACIRLLLPRTVCLVAGSTSPLSNLSLHVSWPPWAHSADLHPVSFLEPSFHPVFAPGSLSCCPIAGLPIDQEGLCCAPSLKMLPNVRSWSYGDGACTPLPCPRLVALLPAKLPRGVSPPSPRLTQRASLQEQPSCSAPWEWILEIDRSVQGDLWSSRSQSSDPEQTPWLADWDWQSAGPPSWVHCP